jgi:transposase
VRTGWYREVAVKSLDGQLIRSLITTRAQLVRMRVDLANQIRGVLKPFGLVAAKGGGQPFVDWVRTLVTGGPLVDVAEALLSAWQVVSRQITLLSRCLILMAMSVSEASVLHADPPEWRHIVKRIAKARHLLRGPRSDWHGRLYCKCGDRRHVRGLHQPLLA